MKSGAILAATSLIPQAKGGLTPFEAASSNIFHMSFVISQFSFHPLPHVACLRAKPT